MKSILYAALCAATLLTTACASNPDGLQMASATTIGHGYLSSDIQVSDINRKATRVSWTAKTPKGATYACEADDMVRRPNCVEQKRK